MLPMTDRSGHSLYDDNHVRECTRRASRRENSRPGAFCSPRRLRDGRRRLNILCAGFRPRSLRAATQSAVVSDQESTRHRSTSPEAHSSHHRGPHDADSCGEPTAVWNGIYALDHAIAGTTTIEDICKAERTARDAAQQGSGAASKLLDGIEPAS
jgi:hypothetical protein